MYRFRTLLFFCAALIVDCSGGDTGSDGITVPHPFNGAVSPGDLVDFTLNLPALGETAQANFSLTRVAGDRLPFTELSGDLTPKAGFGDFVYDTSGGDLLVTIPDLFAVLALVDLGEVVVGAPHLDTVEPADIAATYNYVGALRSGSSAVHEYGTFVLDAAGTWQRYLASNPVGLPTASGTWADAGGGVLTYDILGVEAGHFVVTENGDNQILVVDVDTPNLHGVLVAMRQQNAVLPEGEYDVISTDAAQLLDVSVVGGNVTFLGSSLDAVANEPLTGFSTLEDPGGNGQYDEGELIMIGNPAGTVFGGGPDGIFAGVRR